MPANQSINEVLTVSTLNRQVRNCLESTFPLCWVGGEISNLTYAASGHVYFSLKDASAQVRCVMWRSRAQTLGWRLENGQQIEIRALVSFYEPRGEFQLNVEAVRRAGQGDLFERFLRLKAQLEKEGLFAVDRKRALPKFPRHVAIVTSPQAAALRDVLSTLHRRAPHLQLTLLPTPVQGEAAGPRIAAAIVAAGKTTADSVLLCRGGGSIEDLWAFNEECVARAIAACAKPVVCGVGHETDFTIADFAADLRAPTPTAAAELIAPERDALRAGLTGLAQRLQRHWHDHQNRRLQALDWAASRLIHPAERIARQRQMLSQLTQRLSLAQGARLARWRMLLGNLARRQGIARPATGPRLERLAAAQRRLELADRQRRNALRMKLSALDRGLRQLDPHAVLARGYALVSLPDGRTLRDAAAVDAGQPIKIALARGQLDASVIQVVPPVEAD